MCSTICKGNYESSASSAAGGIDGSSQAYCWQSPYPACHHFRKYDHRTNLQRSLTARPPRRHRRLEFRQNTLSMEINRASVARIMARSSKRIPPGKMAARWLFRKRCSLTVNGEGRPPFYPKTRRASGLSFLQISRFGLT